MPRASPRVYMAVVTAMVNTNHVFSICKQAGTAVGIRGSTLDFNQILF